MTRLIVLGILALAACSSGGPPPAPPAPQQPWVPTPPVFALIGERQELNLTSAQVTALDSIGVALQSQNRPALNELQDIQMSGGGFARRPSAAALERARPLVDTIRENNRRAQEAVRALLTDAQRAQVCRMFAPDRDEVRRRQAQLQQQPRRGGFTTDTIATNVFAGPWLWCRGEGASAPPPAAADTTRAAADTTTRRP